jgi:hypothetical protein
MTAFPDTLVFRDAGMAGGSRVFELAERFRYRSSRGEITVPVGFRTDGASVPRVFWNLFSPFGDYFGAAVVHDFLYSPHNRRFSRTECDALFLEAMFNLGVGWFTRGLIYRAVRLGGGGRFKGNPPRP